MSDCILCSGALNGSGYGSAYHRGKRVGAHVAAFLAANGLEPADIKGQTVQHSCDNRPCINPAHLSLGTQSQNLKDMVTRKRHGLVVRCGEDNGNCVLPDSAVEAIRSRYIKGARFDNPDSAQALAKEFGVSRVLISKITQGVARVRPTTTYTS